MLTIINSVTQFFIYISTRYFFRPILGMKYVDKSTLYKGGQYLIVANHITGMDPFFASCAMRPRNFFRTMPHKYMTANKFMANPIMNVILSSFGSFHAREHRHRPYGIEASKAYIAKGRPVLIFPEGKIVKPGLDYKLHSGAKVILNSSSIKLIPIKIEARNPKKPNSFIWNIVVTVGNPIDVNDVTTKELMEIIKDLT